MKTKPNLSFAVCVDPNTSEFVAQVSYYDEVLADARFTTEKEAIMWCRDWTSGSELLIMDKFQNIQQIHWLDTLQQTYKM